MREHPYKSAGWIGREDAYESPYSRPVSPQGIVPEAAATPEPAMIYPDGYAVLTSDNQFVGIWRSFETAKKILNRSPSAKGERLVKYAYAETIAARVIERKKMVGALTEACAAIAAGMVVAARVPGANDTLTVLQTAFAIARAAIADAERNPE